MSWLPEYPYSYVSKVKMMALEIERKFLVVGTAWQSAAGIKYSQGYLNHDKHRTVRVRLAGDKAFLTIKGETTGFSRLEFEYEIPLSDGEQLLALCEHRIIEKIRRVIDFKGFKWEVDEFLGAHSGLVIAEIELSSESEVFEKPDWIGDEVTNDLKYSNSNLSLSPG